MLQGIAAVRGIASRAEEVYKILAEKFSPRAIVTSDNPDLKKYRLWVGAAAVKAIEKVGKIDGVTWPLAGPVAVRTVFYQEAPEKMPKGRYLPDIRPDLDKLERAIFDALTEIGWLDDGQICFALSGKLYGPKAGVRIRVYLVQTEIQKELL